MGWLRHPKTTQEIRMWDRQYGRANRSPRHLPTLYDDIPTPYNVRCWKKYRKTQYKIKQFGEHVRS